MEVRHVATEHCQRAPVEAKPVCYTTLHGRLVDLFSAADDRQRVCRGFEPAYRKPCPAPAS